MGDHVFLKMSYHPCVSGRGHYLVPQESYDCCLTCLGIQHAEEAFVDDSCSSCGDMTISELRNRLCNVKHAPPDDRMSIAASEGELSLSGDDDSAALPPSGVVALSESDPEMTAMLSWAAENVGLVWNPPPRPDSSRLDEWSLGGGRAEKLRAPPSGAILPRSAWWAYKIVEGTFHCPKQILWLLPLLTTLNGGAALGHTGIPSVERSVGMQLCPTAATTLWGDLCLPSRACLYLSGLTGSAYRSCGETASALHAMALLQIHQVRALKDLPKGDHDLAVLHELRAATDLTLRATKVTAQSRGCAMSALVVQERHLWLCLADMEQEKVQFLNAPVSQTGLETGYMAEYQGGHGNSVLTGFRLHRPKAEPSARGQIPRFFGQECPWSRYSGMLCYSRLRSVPLPNGRARFPSCLNDLIVQLPSHQ